MSSPIFTKSPSCTLRYFALGLTPEQNDTRNYLRFNENSNSEYILNLFLNKKISHELIVTKTFPSSSIEDAYSYLMNKNNKERVTCLLKWK